MLDACPMLVLGATGDLTGRYLLPALARLAAAGRLPEGLVVRGVARHHWDGRRFSDHAASQLDRHAGDVPDDWADQFREFVRGSDVLIHDAMFTADEYPMRVGWGHSTFDQVVDLALSTDVSRLFFFHHSPERSDDELESGQIVGDPYVGIERLNQRLARRPDPFLCD